MQCLVPGLQDHANMNGTSEQADILPPNCMVKDRWKVHIHPFTLTFTHHIRAAFSSLVQHRFSTLRGIWQGRGGGGGGVSEDRSRSEVKPGRDERKTDTRRPVAQEDEGGDRGACVVSSARVGAPESPTGQGRSLRYRRVNSPESDRLSAAECRGRLSVQSRMDILGSPSRHVYSSQPAQMLSVDPGCRGDGQVSGRQEASVASADQEAHSNAFIRSVPLAEEEDFDSKEWVIIDKEAELRDFLPTTSGTTDEEPEELRPLEEQEERRRLRGAGSRGMLTLTEEEASRRSGGSPAQSPCHSLPSGRPRRRESEPTGPHRPVRHRSATGRELFHILPQLQAKRADFLSVMLTGTLPQRRGLAPPEEPVPEPPGPGDDDVTKSQSNSDASQKSTEHSQDAAPSTLMAEDHRGQREHASAADADPDLEDASKTLVLFSPGDTRKSPSGAEVALEAELATPTALASHADRLAVGDGVQPEVSDTGRLSPALRFDLRPSTPIAPASPPFTKVERTFIHIAETSHLNIMSSNGHSARDGDLGGEETVSRGAGTPARYRCSGGPSQREGTPSRYRCSGGPSQREGTPSRYRCSGGPSQREGTPARYRCSGGPIRSRIPILMSEEDSGSEQSSSLSARARLQQRARQLDLARLLVQKQQGRWMRRRMLSGTSSSLSSGDDERRRASETLSTAGSEEDTHTSDEPKRCSRLKTTEESKEGRSKIPRPVTPVRRSPRGLTAAAAAAASSLCVPDMSSTKASFTPPAPTGRGSQSRPGRRPARRAPPPPAAAPACPSGCCLEPDAASAPPTAGPTVPPLRERSRRPNPGSCCPCAPPPSLCSRPGPAAAACGAAHRRKPRLRPGLGPKPPAQPGRGRPPGREQGPPDNRETGCWSLHRHRPSGPPRRPSGPPLPLSQPAAGLCLAHSAW
uniref:Tau tubulin kinase 1b n=1 Tax=Salarias fasciatus TaxID=181472 RepID=A0A672G999_SALFA